MLKSLLIGLVAVLVLVTGATAASSNKSKNPLRPGTVHRLCVWVEQGGTPDTAWDLKAVKAYTATHKVCIEGKKGKPGKNGKNGKAGAKGAQGNAGAIGAQGSAGAKGEAGAKGDAGAKGSDGANGTNGVNGDKGDRGSPGIDGANGVSVVSADEPAGANCADGGSKFTAANGVTYACNGADGQDGEDGENGFSGLITVEGGSITGDKQFTVSCPLIDEEDPSLGRLEAISGGFKIQGSVTADFRSDASGDPDGSDSWTIIQSSGNDDSGTVYVYCMAPATP